MKVCTSFILLNLFLLLSQSYKASLYMEDSSSGLSVSSVTSTGETTGHIGTIYVANNSDAAIAVQAESFYIPAIEKYQPYYGRIPENVVIPPNGESAIPINGYCVDVGKPPVPAGQSFQSMDKWVAVGEGPAANEVSLIPGDPLPPYTPDDQNEIISSDVFHEDETITFDNLTVTWPGTNDPFGGTIKLEDDPELIAPLIVEIVERIILATEDIAQSDVFTTPISADPVRETNAITQQTIWIVMGAITGNVYTKEDFTVKVHEQFEQNTGNPIATLPEEEQESIQKGVNDFWGSFTATGVEAKVIDSPGHLLTVSPQCECENIEFHLNVKRGRRDVHDEDHTTENTISSNSIKIEVPDFKMGNEFEVKITNITVNCDCNENECNYYPAESTNSGSPGFVKADTDKPGKVDILIENEAADASNENHNCTNSENEWNTDGDEYSMRITTVDEDSNNAAVFQRFYIKAYCQLDDCGRDLCKRRIQLNFVSEK